MRVLLFALAASLAAGVLSGLYPALKTTKPDVAATLKDEGGRTGTGAASRLRKGLVAAQIAVSLLLLISAGLFSKSLLNLSRVDLGFRTDHLLTFSLSPKLNKYDDARTAALYEQLLARLTAVPGAESASGSNIPAIADSISSLSISIDGFTPADGNAVDVNTAVLAPDYFRTLGIPLVAGRDFSLSDAAKTPGVTIVNQAFARKFLNGRDPLGRSLTLAKKRLQIVGVIADTKYSSVKEAPPAVFYTAQRQQDQQQAMFFYLRTRTPPENTASAVRRAVAELDAGLPLRNLRTMDAQIRENIFEDRIMTQLTALFAGLAALLAGAGIYGVLAYNVARRTREIGIRAALGATTRRVRAMVLGEAVWMLAIGALFGLAGAAGATRLLASQLFGLQPWDPIVYLAATALLTALTLISAYLPARAASAVDPMTALRNE
ncbi:MAG TPA: FtsX-like permease family protein [Bryobacteraceae bacterium]